MFLLDSCVHLPFRFGIHLYDFFAFKKKSHCLYNFDDAMWFARREKSNGKGNM
jgi:hypothetical protein